MFKFSFPNEYLPSMREKKKVQINLLGLSPFYSQV